MNVNPSGIGQYPPRYGKDYPFAKPSVDIKGLLSDFWLSYSDPGSTFVLPLRLAWLAGFGDEEPVVWDDGGPLLWDDGSDMTWDDLAVSDSLSSATHDADLAVVNAVGAVVFDTTTAERFSSVAWNSNYTVHEWSTADQACRVVAYAAGAEVPYYFEPQQSVLDARTYNRLPLRLRSLNGLQGGVKLVCGFNVDLETAVTVPAANPLRPSTTLVLSGSLGAGQGRKPSCPDTASVSGTAPVVRTIAGAGPLPSGNFVLSLDQCMRTQPPVSMAGAVAPNTVTLDDSCPSCCTCADYRDTYSGLYSIYEAWNKAAAKSSALRDLYRDNRARWLAISACRTAHPLTMMLLAEPDCQLFAACSFSNFSQTCCLDNVYVRFTFELYNSSGGSLPWPATAIVNAVRITINGVESNGTPSIHGPVYVFASYTCDPQAAIIVRSVLLLPCTAGQNVKLTVTVHASPTGTSCPAAGVAIPGDIAALWAANGLSNDGDCIGIVSHTTAVQTGD